MIVGLCGSVLFGWQLILSANSIIEDQLQGQMLIVSSEEHEELRFPVAVPDTYLIAQYPVLYEGPFMEDGSGDYVVDVAAVVLFNTSQTGIDYARVVFRWDKGEYVFEAQMLPPRQAVLVLDKDRQKFAQQQWYSCTGTQETGEGEWLDQQTVAVEDVDDVTICVRNNTDRAMQDIRIYYKSYLLPEQLYVGGITYCAGLGELAPGESVQISPFRYVKDHSRIIRTSYTSQTNVDIFVR